MAAATLNIELFLMPTLMNQANEETAIRIQTRSAQARPACLARDGKRRPKETKLGGWFQPSGSPETEEECGACAPAGPGVGVKKSIRTRPMGGPNTVCQRRYRSRTKIS